MVDLLALGYQADITRVSTMQFWREGGGPPNYSWIGIPDQHHELSHHQNNPEKLAKINTYHLEVFSSLVDKLRATRDGDGTLLDHSMLMYGSGMSDGDLHSPLDLPLMLVGKGSGTVRGNQHIRYPDAKKVPMTNLLLTLIQKAGVPADSFGDSTGELTEI